MKLFQASSNSVATLPKSQRARHYMFFYPSIHSLLPATLALMAGICWQQGAVHFLWLATASVLLCASLTQKTRLSILLCFVAFSSGALLLHRQLHAFDEFHNRTENKHRIMYGTVIDAQSKNATIETNDGAIQLTLQPEQVLVIGDTVEIGPLNIKRPDKQYILSLIRKGLIARAYVPKKASIKVLMHPAWSWRCTQAGLRQGIMDSCQKKLSPSAYTLFATIFLGNKQTSKDITQAQQELFSWWGIVHQLARSGLHLVIFLILLRWGFGFMPIPYTMKLLLLLMIVLVYAALSWTSVSFTRALLTFIAYCLYDLVMVPVHILHLITLVTLIVLVFNPAQLFFLDFQLSFGLTFALALLSHMRTMRKITLNN
jgi:ComEC/Rec2-related protein